MPLINEPLDGVGDLELASRRGLDGLDRLEDRRVEHVDADQCEVGRRDLRLLDEPHHLAVPELGHAELRRIRYPGQQDLALRLLVAETPDERLELLADQVVAQVHAEESEPRKGSDISTA